MSGFGEVMKVDHKLELFLNMLKSYHAINNFLNWTKEKRFNISHSLTTGIYFGD